MNPTWPTEAQLQKALALLERNGEALYVTVLRDQIAWHVLPQCLAILVESNSNYKTRAVDMAYELADLMIAKRKENTE
jgi:hypothetical protein